MLPQSHSRHPRRCTSLLLVLAALLAATGTSLGAAAQPANPAATTATTAEAAPATEADAADDDVLAGEPAEESRSSIEELPEPPTVTAKAWAVYDGVDGTRLAGLGADDARPIASLTKIMTALVVTKRTQGNETVRISPDAAEVGDGAGLGVQAGQRYTVDALLRATLVYSANDAAEALAEHVGKDQEGFIELMNEEAESLELSNTTFTSVTGLDPESGSLAETTQSSPADLVTLARVAMREPRIREAVRTEQVTIQRPGGEPAILGNRNLLLGEYAGVDGVKTGHTDAAGYCLLTHYDDSEGRELWVVVLGVGVDESRFTETRALLDWGVPLRQTVPVMAAGDRVATAPVAGSRSGVGLFASEDVAISVRIGEFVKQRVVVPSPVDPPVQEGDEIGRVEFVVDGEVAGRSRLFVDRTLRQPSRWERARDAAGDWRVAMRAGWDQVERTSSRLRDDLGT